jgi:hypothetical protein
MGFASVVGFVGLVEAELDATDCDLRALGRALRILRVTSLARPALAPVALRLRGRLLDRAGRARAARRMLRRALARAEALDLSYEAARTRCDLARTLEPGDAERSALAEQAARDLDKLGAAWDAARARDAAAAS